MKVAIGVPLPQYINSTFLQNLVGIITYTITKVPQVTELHYIDKGGVRTDKNRNVILKNAIEQGVDYILWLDADMMYPHDIVETYLKEEFDVMGCLYFKRSAPFDPIGYVAGTNPIKPYRCLNPDVLARDSVVEVDGLGFGGTMVNMRVYEAMGDDKWMNYGGNFHLPFETTDQLTHDLVFCKKAKEYGFKIHLHTGVRPGHLAESVITEADWRREKKEEVKKTVTVLMPTINPKKAKKMADIIKARAGYPCRVAIAEDIKKTGWVATSNALAREYPSDYYVFAADDVFPGKEWLSIAMKTAEATGAGLVALNDGKWFGRMASFGLVEHKFMVENYGGDLFFSGYKSHYADPELTVLAKSKGRYAYSPDSLFIEVHDKRGKNNNPADRKLFSERKSTGFDGKVSDKELINQFS